MSTTPSNLAELIQSMPDEFHASRLRERAKELGLKIPRGLVAIIEDNGFKATRSGYARIKHRAHPWKTAPACGIK